MHIYIYTCIYNIYIYINISYVIRSIFLSAAQGRSRWQNSLAKPPNDSSNHDQMEARPRGGQPRQGHQGHQGHRQLLGCRHQWGRSTCSIPERSRSDWSQSLWRRAFPPSASPETAQLATATRLRTWTFTVPNSKIPCLEAVMQHGKEKDVGQHVHGKEPCSVCSHKVARRVGHELIENSLIRQHELPNLHWSFEFCSTQVANDPPEYFCESVRLAKRLRQKRRLLKSLRFVLPSPWSRACRLPMEGLVCRWHDQSRQEFAKRLPPSLSHSQGSWQSQTVGRRSLVFKGSASAN